MNAMPSAFARAALLVSVCVPLCGCLVMSNREEHMTGKYVGAHTFDQIEPGKTKADWVEATLGEPTEKKKFDDASEIWKYTYTQHKDSQGAIFLVFAGNDSRERRGTAYIELEDGVVQKKWRD